MGRYLKPVISIVVIGVLFGGIYLFFKGKTSEKPETEYETAIVERGDIHDTVTATGVLQPLTEVDVKSNVGGEIVDLLVDLGDFVRKGQVIARIDPTDPLTAQQQADADFSAAVARIAQAQSGLELESLQVASRLAAAQHSITAARARVVEADARVKEAKATADAEPDIFDARLAETEASQEQAQQALKSSQERKRVVEATTVQAFADAKNDAIQAKASTDTAERDYRRKRDLLARGFVPVSEVESAYASRESAKASYQTALQRSNTIEKQNAATLAEADLSILEARARLRQSDSALARVKKDEVFIEVRQREHEAAQANHDQSLAGVKQVQAEYETAKAAEIQIKIAKSEIITAEAQKTRARASQTQADKNVGYTTVVASRDGIVLQRFVEVGTVIASGRSSVVQGSSIIQLGDMSIIEVVSQVDETDIAQVYKNQAVVVIVDAYPLRKMEGIVVRIDPMAIEEDNVTTIPVTVHLTNPPEDLRPSLKPAMNAECEFVITDKKDVLHVPNTAVKQLEDSSYVVSVMQEDGVPTDMPVEIGLADPLNTEIVTGLQEGMTVVTKVIEPDEEENKSPFGNPFGVFGNRRRDENRTRGGQQGGAPGAGGGQRPGGGAPGAGGGQRPGGSAPGAGGGQRPGGAGGGQRSGGAGSTSGGAGSTSGGGR